ncbi:unnamed protein product [Closterium sp. NIES-53]
MASLRLLAFDHEGRPVQFDTWLDDLQLYLLSDSKDSVSLFDLALGTATAPPATADSSIRSQWLTRDAAARLAIRNHLPFAECAHFVSLRRPVYGLRQAPREWHDTLRTTLVALGFAPATADPSLFLRTDTSLPPLYILVYIYDLVFAIADTKAQTLVKSFSASASSSPRHSPLLCLPTTRSQLHLQTSPTSGMELVLGGRGPVDLTGHADASWVDDSAMQRSSQGYTFSLGPHDEGCILAARKVPTILPKLLENPFPLMVLLESPTPTFYALMAIAAQELRWLTYLLTDLGEQPRSPPVLYVDNKAMIALCQEHRLEHRTKHIARRYYLARELQQRGQLRLAYVVTRVNIADVFTKALPPGDHQRFVTLLSLLALLFLTGLVTTCSPPFCLWGVSTCTQLFGGSNFNGGCGSSGYGNDNKKNGRGRGQFDGECHFCHKSGHMWCDCCKLPDGWTPAQGQEGRGAGGGRGRGRGGRGGRGGGAASMKSAGIESESRDDRFPGQFFFVSTQTPAGPEKDEGFEEPAAVGKVTLHSLDYWVIDSGATYSMTPRAELLTELEPSPVKHVTSALGQRAEVKGMGKAMFKGADGKMVGLKNVLWVPNLAANLISVRRLQKAGMDTSSKGAKTYTARLGERNLWDLHEDRDVYNEMWQIPVVPMPKERQVAASISTKGEAVGSGDGANGRAKEMKSKKCNLGGTSKLGEHEESGAAAQKQHKGEENPRAAAEEEYGENIEQQRHG